MLGPFGGAGGPEEPVGSGVGLGSVSVGVGVGSVGSGVGVGVDGSGVGVGSGALGLAGRGWSPRGVAPGVGALAP